MTPGPQLNARTPYINVETVTTKAPVSEKNTSVQFLIVSSNLFSKKMPILEEEEEMLPRLEKEHSELHRQWNCAGEKVIFNISTQQMLLSRKIWTRKPRFASLAG